MKYSDLYTVEEVFRSPLERCETTGRVPEPVVDRRIDSMSNSEFLRRLSQALEEYNEELP